MRYHGRALLALCIPLIHGADGAKLSKRHGTGVEAYKDMGFCQRQCAII